MPKDLGIVTSTTDLLKKYGSKKCSLTWQELWDFVSSNNGMGNQKYKIRLWLLKLAGLV